MRTTKVIAFSVPPEFETEIQSHAEAEHRTISEYVREAIRQYMDLQQFEKTRTTVTQRLKKKGLKASSVSKEVEKLRKRS